MPQHESFLSPVAAYKSRECSAAPQHLLQGDFAGLLVPRAAFTGPSREGPQILNVGLALLFKMVEGIFRVGIAVQLQVHLRTIRLELRQFLTHEPVHTCSIAVALGMGKMREHFRYRKAGRAWAPIPYLRPTGRRLIGAGSRGALPTGRGSLIPILASCDSCYFPKLQL
jgi:hypothetical protein